MQLWFGPLPCIKTQHNNNGVFRFTVTSIIWLYTTLHGKNWLSACYSLCQKDYTFFFSFMLEQILNPLFFCNTFLFLSYTNHLFQKHACQDRRCQVWVHVKTMQALCRIVTWISITLKRRYARWATIFHKSIGIVLLKGSYA